MRCSPRAFWCCARWRPRSRGWGSASRPPSPWPRALVAGVGFLLTRAARRYFPTRASYPVRQGVSNLFRPQNQTISVTLALGFGAFVIGTILEVEGSVRDDLTLSLGQGQPNVLLFDVQPDQLQGVLDLIPEDARASADVTPIVTSRIAMIDGRDARRAPLARDRATTDPTRGPSDASTGTRTAPRSVLPRRWSRGDGGTARPAPRTPRRSTRATCRASAWRRTWRKACACRSGTPSRGT